MGRLGTVIKSYLAIVPGTGVTAQYVAVEEFAGDERKAQVFGPPNEDFAPAETTQTYDEQLGTGRGFLAALGYYNPYITPVAIAGERRIYSTSADGKTLKAQLHLKQDGTIYAANDNATITISPAGVITVVAADDIVATAAADIIATATAIKLNGDAYTLTMFEQLSDKWDSHITTEHNAHRHTSNVAGSPTSVPTVQSTLNISDAQAASLQTDG